MQKNSLSNFRDQRIFYILQLIQWHLPDPRFGVKSYLHQQQTRLPFCICTIAALHGQVLAACSLTLLITLIDWNIKSQCLYIIFLFLIGYLSCGCLSSTIEIASETEMSSGCSSLTLPVCNYQKLIKLNIKIRILISRLMIEKHHWPFAALCQHLT